MFVLYSCISNRKKWNSDGTETIDEREKIKCAIEHAMGDNYELCATKPVDLIVYIKCMTFKYSENEMLEKL